MPPLLCLLTYHGIKITFLLVGPHRALAPGVKYDGRIGEIKNYRYIVHYPADGKYTIKRLPMTKLGGRDPVTKLKIIQVVHAF